MLLPLLGVICKLTKGTLDPLIQVTDKDIKQNSGIEIAFLVSWFLQFGC